MRGRRETHRAPALTIAAGLAVALALPGAGGAGPAANAEGLRARQATLGTRAHAALMSLYSLDSRLARSRAELSSLRIQVSALRKERMRVSRDEEIARFAWQRSIDALGTHLRTLYEQGEQNGIAVLFGATSIDDALTRIDELERSARLNRQTIAQARSARRSLARLRRTLAARAAELRRLEAAAAQTTSSLVAARARRVAYLASLARQRSLNARQIGRLEASAKRISERAQVITAQQTTAPVASPTPNPVVAPGRTMTVTATAYSMPGHTATGMPVGWGVVAVDPSFIPLGTRMTIPGYGEGVAADTGSGVHGAMIDLWFPTLPQALAWGSRTVTITLH